MVRNSSALTVYGPTIRKDWLDDLGPPIPETMDDWHTVLKAFKEKKGATAPFTGKYLSGQKWDIQDVFIGAFKTSNGFYLDDQGKVKYGPVDPQFKDALTLLRSWYAEGLIDKDFAVPDDSGNLQDNKMTGGASGATVAATGGGMGRWLDIMKAKDPKYNLVAAPYPTLKKGEKAFIGQRYFKYNPSASTAVTTGAKDPKLAVQWLDYAFGQEGKMLFNFGIEGESYKMDNGKPVFTDLILHNSKFNVQQILSQYTKQNGPFPTDDRRNTNTYKQQDEASAIWSATDADKHTPPLFITPSQDESKELAKIMTAISGYKEEMFVKFIMGKEPLENFDKYVQRLKTMGIDKALKINQDAYDRYQKR
ncbi:hypothetical protein LJK88_09300 [Paenibacillus sp. P26]|nr:hypothetical protein LJK88_09300 [Paenibacillus sp. P26]